tara:strand:+ start:571 stop:756 length:186 start_codon:yes stop_codon:yes gene_type:complete
MKAIVTRNFKTSKGIRITEGSAITILPLVGVTNRADLVQVIGSNFKMNTLRSIINNLSKEI